MIKKCLYCNSVIPVHVPHYQKRKNCSKSCSNAYRWTIPKWRKEHLEKMTNQIKGKFLGRKHTSTTLKKMLMNTPRGETHYAWKGDNARKHSGRRRAQRLYPKQPCEKCGRIDDVERHHVDKNALNNSRENIIFVCPAHHRPIYHKSVLVSQPINGSA